ncbi:hypothetical protein [Burkholderia cepacia]|nr:hypothetical protein [Burkholderia cepacia]
MHPKEAVTLITGPVRGGLLDLGQFGVTVFAHAAANGGPFRMTVIAP